MENPKRVENSSFCKFLFVFNSVLFICECSDVFVLISVDTVVDKLINCIAVTPVDQNVVPSPLEYK